MRITSYPVIRFEGETDTCVLDKHLYDALLKIKETGRITWSTKDTRDYLNVKKQLDAFITVTGDTLTKARVGSGTELTETGERVVSMYGAIADEMESDANAMIGPIVHAKGWWKKI